MAHAVQMSKFVLECYKMLIQLEKVYAAHEKDRWTEEDDRAIARIIEEMDADDAAAKFFDDNQGDSGDEEAENTDGVG